MFVKAAFPKSFSNTWMIYAFPWGPFFPMSDLWICGMTPPPAIVALMRESNSSSPRMASCKWRGVILFTFKSLLAFPANSRTSAVRYSKIAALYTAAVAPTRPWLVVLCFRCLWIRPTGNWSPVIGKHWLSYEFSNCLIYNLGLQQALWLDLSS